VKEKGQTRKLSVERHREVRVKATYVTDTSQQCCGRVMDRDGTSNAPGTSKVTARSCSFAYSATTAFESKTVTFLNWPPLSSLMLGREE
jgi:hypothetical protein